MMRQKVRLTSHDEPEGEIIFLVEGTCDTTCVPPYFLFYGLDIIVILVLTF